MIISKAHQIFNKLLAAKMRPYRRRPGHVRRSALCILAGEAIRCDAHACAGEVKIHHLLAMICDIAGGENRILYHALLL